MIGTRYTRRRANRRRLPYAPALPPPFKQDDWERAIGIAHYKTVTLRFDLYTQTWRVRLSGTGTELGEISRESSNNEIAAALDAAIAEAAR